MPIFPNEPKELSQRTRENAREREAGFTALLDGCLGKHTAPARGAALRLEEALARIRADWTERGLLSRPGLGGA